MKKEFIYLALLFISMASCESSNDELTTKNEAKAISEKTYISEVSEKNDSIIILSRTKIFPKIINSSKTGRMIARVYLETSPGNDRIVADSGLSWGKLVLRIQADGNLCFNIVEWGTESNPQPNEQRFLWGAFNYAHPTGNYQLVNDSNGNVAIFNSNTCIWASSTETSTDFDDQYLEIITYRKNTDFFNLTNRKTFAKLQLMRQYSGQGNYQWIKTFYDDVIGG